MAKAQEAWIRTVEDVSGGNLTIALDKAAPAAPEGDYDLVRNGVRDMGWHAAASTPGRFDMLRAVELPILCPNAIACSQALWIWYDKYELAEKEFGDTKLLTVFVSAPSTVHMLKPVRNLDDIKSIKIAASSADLQAVQALGLAAVAMPASEAREALRRGSVGGVLLPYEAVESLAELTRTHLEFPGGFHAAPFVMVMNKDAFGRLTASNQAALLKASGEAGATLFGKAWDDADEAGRAGAKSRGNTIETLAAAELDPWKAVLKGERENWVRMADARGFDGQTMLKELEMFVKCKGPKRCAAE
jgi:TRAP-type C4-dicarboxylate transport system substrate-binding protein